MKDLLSNFPEINPNNYGDDEVNALNAWGIAAHTMLEQQAAEIERLNSRWSEWKDSLNSVMEQRNALQAKLSAMEAVEPEARCAGRSYCSRMPFCGCGGPEGLPERDTSKPAEAQGLFRKFNVTRTDGSSAPGGKHHGCEYFVLDVDHDQHAKAALQAYALACAAPHPQLSADLMERYGIHPQSTQPAPKVAQQPLTDEWIRERCNQTWVFNTVKEWVRMIEEAHNIGGQQP